MRRILTRVTLAGLAVAGIVLVLIVGLGDGPGAGSTAPGSLSPSPAEGADDGGAARPPFETRLATVLQFVKVYGAPGGRPIRDEWGESDQGIDPGRQVTVIGDAVTIPTGKWVRVFVEVDPSVWPGDFFAWLPVAQDGQPVLDVGQAVECPAEPTLNGLAELTPWDRLRCAGSRELTFEARTGFAAEYAGYAVQPAFFGGRDDIEASVSLADAGDAGGLFRWRTNGGLDAVRAPGLGPLPLDFDLRVTGQFDHPAALACRRTDANPAGPGAPPDAGMPPEAPEDSVAWCRSRFVVTAWSIVRGPERRPLVAGEIQLHRNAGGGNACAGVGMAPLVFRVDLTEPDPVWIEAGGAARVIPTFSAEFRFVTDPEPGIADASGVLIRDGTVVNPDAALAGHPVCPMGSVVSFH